MDLKEKVYSVLLVSPSKNFLMTMNELFSEYPFSPVCAESSISKAKQRLLEKQFDFIIINLPPGAQGSFRFAIDVGRAKSNVVLMLIPREQYETAYEQVAEHGVYLLPKPTSKAMVVQALDWMLTTGERLKKMERKTLSVEEKMQEIRMINRAKWLLIEQMNMTEAEAHRYIEKQAMDRCVPRLKVAEEIISG